MTESGGADDGLARQARGIAWSWAALIALMLASLGSAWLRLGVFNAVAGPAIAALKAAIVAWWFMRLGRAGPLLRIVAVAGPGLLGIQIALTGLDYATRAQTPAAVQRPRLLLPLPAAPESHALGMAPAGRTPRPVAPPPDPP